MSEETKAVVTSTFVCPNCNQEIVIERPVATRRGQLTGIALEDMTLEQLKREKINASSVLYKATKRNAPADLIAKNQARVDAVVAEIAKRVGTPAEATTETVEETTTDDVYSDEV